LSANIRELDEEERSRNSEEMEEFKSGGVLKD